MTKGRPWDLLFEKIVVAKVIQDDKNGYFKLFPEDHDHLGEVQHLGQPEVGHQPRGAPEIDFLEKLL